MKPISVHTYENLGGIHHQLNTFITTEKAWYRHDELLGIVLLDNIDHDWSFVALAHDPRMPPDLAFRCFDVGASFKTFELAETALATALATGPDAGFFTEEV